MSCETLKGSCCKSELKFLIFLLARKIKINKSYDANNAFLLRITLAITIEEIVREKDNSI